MSLYMLVYFAFILQNCRLCLCMYCCCCLYFANISGLCRCCLGCYNILMFLMMIWDSVLSIFILYMFL